VRQLLLDQTARVVGIVVDTLSAFRSKLEKRREFIAKVNRAFDHTRVLTRRHGPKRVKRSRHGLHATQLHAFPFLDCAKCPTSVRSRSSRGGKGKAKGVSLTGCG